MGKSTFPTFGTRFLIYIFTTLSHVTFFDSRTMISTIAILVINLDHFFCKKFQTVLTRNKNFSSLHFFLPFSFPLELSLRVATNLVFSNLYLRSLYLLQLFVYKKNICTVINFHHELNKISSRKNRNVFPIIFPVSFQ